MKSVFALIIYVLVLALILLCSCSGSERRARQEQAAPTNLKKIVFVKESVNEITITSFVKGRETGQLTKGDTILVIFSKTLGFYVMADDRIAPSSGITRLAVVQ